MLIKNSRLHLRTCVKCVSGLTCLTKQIWFATQRSLVEFPSKNISKLLLYSHKFYSCNRWINLASHSAVIWSSSTPSFQIRHPKTFLTHSYRNQAGTRTWHPPGNNSQFWGSLVVNCRLPSGFWRVVDGKDGGGSDERWGREWERERQRERKSTVEVPAL